MLDLIILIVCLSLTFYFATVIRMKVMGMNTRLAIIRSLMYPVHILLIHYRMYRKYNDRPIRVRLRILLMPIISPQETIVNYAHMHLRMDATYNVIQEMLIEASTDNEREEILKTLEKEGIIERVYKKSILTNQESYLNDYEQFSKRGTYRYKMG